MCGISVIINTGSLPIENSLVQRLNSRISHRGPDNEGIFHGSNFALGHRRLSILDGCEHAHQPLRYRNHYITFNGEVYNHIEIREELIRLGHRFATRSDTEVIVAAYDQWGDQCVSRFEGMWSFVIYDVRKNILFGSRDRFGLKPFYYGTFGRFFTIASEVKQFMEVPGFKPILNQAVAFNFLNYAALNYSDETFFEGVQALTPGHNMVYELSSHHYAISKWYYFTEARTSKLHLEDAAYEFRQLFNQSVAARLNSDVNVGACLSGGLDSSSIVCTAKEILNSDANFLTLSICWNDEEIDERPFIKSVAHHSGSANQQIFPDINDLNREDILDKIIYHQDQPIPSASHFSDYKVYEGAARAGLPVMLDGQGADEYLGGYGIFNWFHLHGLLSGFQFGHFVREWRAVKRSCGFSQKQMVKTFIKYGMNNRALNPFINESWGKQFLNSNPNVPPPGDKLNARNLSHNQVFTSSLPYQLHSADRNSMCHSIESRLPFLDHRLVEFCYSLPDTFKISNGMSKYVLREGLKSVLPEKIRERKSKLGFPAPEVQWMRDNAPWILKEFDKNADALSQFVSPAKVKSEFMRVSWSGRGDYSPFFRILTFARWLKIFNVSTSASSQRVHAVTGGVKVEHAPFNL